MKKAISQKKRKRVKFVEQNKNYVVINGRFIVIDDADNSGNATAIKIFPKDKKEKDDLIKKSVKNFCSGGGGHFEVGETQFSLTDIWKGNPGNKGLAKHEQPRKIVVIKNKETREIFLIARNDVSLKEIDCFIDAVNKKRPYGRPVQTPRAEGGFDQIFTVVVHGDILAIKLEFD